MSAIIRNGMLVEATQAAVRALQTTGLATYTATAPFHAIVAGQTVAFHGDQTVLLAPSMASALIALGAKLTLVP